MQTIKYNTSLLISSRFGILPTLMFSVSILLELSSLVRALYIEQDNFAGLDSKGRFFFGLHNADWAPIILDMFSRKVDKLSIKNQYCLKYLSRDDADLLRQV